VTVSKACDAAVRDGPYLRAWLASACREEDRIHSIQKENEDEMSQVFPYGLSHFTRSGDRLFSFREGLSGTRERISSATCVSAMG
jgi:hypothetical protein